MLYIRKTPTTFSLEARERERFSINYKYNGTKKSIQRDGLEDKAPLFLLLLLLLLLVLFLFLFLFFPLFREPPPLCCC